MQFATKTAWELYLEDVDQATLQAWLKHPEVDDDSKERIRSRLIEIKARLES